MAQSASFWNGSVWKDAEGIWVWDGADWVPVRSFYVWNGSEWKLFFGGLPTVEAVSHSIFQEAVDCATTFIVQISFNLTPVTFDNTTYKLALYNDNTDTVLVDDIYAGVETYNYNTGDGRPVGLGANSASFGDYSIRIIRRSDSVEISSSSTVTADITYNNLGNDC